MALNQRLARLERVSHRSTEAETVIVLACSCGWTERDIPPDFNGHVIRVIRSGDCPHHTSDPPRQAQGAQAPDPASA